MPPRPMTPAEKRQYQALFPNLNVNNVVVTDGPTSAYNCIAWTVGLTNRWLWPGNTLTQFDVFYRGFGYARSGSGDIAAWGRSPSGMTHGSISGPGHGPRWESKCGPGLRIQHGLTELAGSIYGHVIAFYSRSLALGDVYSGAVEEIVKEKVSRLSLSAGQRKILADQVRAVPEAKRAAFEAAFNAWKETWFRGSLAISSDPGARAAGSAFDALVALGPSILPLVVEKLADPENFFALQLYDTLQSDSTLLVHIEPDDPRILEGEQGRARRVLSAWFANR